MFLKGKKTSGQQFSHPEIMVVIIVKATEKLILVGVVWHLSQTSGFFRYFNQKQKLFQMVYISCVARGCFCAGATS